MPFDSNGTFNRVIPGGWKADAAANIKIRADRHDDEDDGFATGLSTCITKDGRTQPTADIPMNGKKITNVGTPVNDTDVANKAYADLPKPSNTGLIIAGADDNGRLTFSSPTGINGLSFVGADLSWLAKIATTTPTVTANRLVLNDKADGTGTDVFSITDTGYTTSNASIIATSTVGVKGAAGNVHVWLYGPNNEDRAVIYTTAAAGGHLNLRVTGTQNFSMNTDGTFHAPAHVYAAGAYLSTDGNTVGSVWFGYGTGHGDAYNAVANKIEQRANAWAYAVGNGCVQSTRMAGETAYNFINASGKWQNSAYVVTGIQKNSAEAYGNYTFFARQPQVYYPSLGWVAAFPF